MHHTGSLDSIPPPPGYPFDQSPNSSPAVPVLTGISPARPLCAGSSHTGSATARRRCSTFAPLAVLFVTVETGSRKGLDKSRRRFREQAGRGTPCTPTAAYRWPRSRARCFTRNQSEPSNTIIRCNWTCPGRKGSPPVRRVLLVFFGNAPGAGCVPPMCAAVLRMKRRHPCVAKSGDRRPSTTPLPGR